MPDWEPDTGFISIQTQITKPVMYISTCYTGFSDRAKEVFIVHCLTCSEIDDLGDISVSTLSYLLPPAFFRPGLQIQKELLIHQGLRKVLQLKTKAEFALKY